MLRKFAALALIILVLPFSPAHAQDIPGSFADVVERLSPMVVNISTTQKVKSGGVQLFGMPFENLPDDPAMGGLRDFMERFGQMQQGDGAAPLEQEVTSLGSGFIIDAEGHVITNNHVVEQAEEITVILSNKDKYIAKLVGRDPKTDLALLKIDADKPLPYATFADSDTIRVGDWVLAIGNPYGLGGSVTKGIISARQRSIQAGPFDDFLQTDAPINRGNSGGPLFNLQGEVVGINTAIFSPTGGNVGIGFAIPSNLAKPVISQLQQFGRTHRAWLGVKIQEVTDEIAESLGLKKAMGALVVDITPDSPAAKAGVKSGDIIVRFDDQPITEMRFLPRIVAETKIGKTVNISVWRDGRTRKLSATLEEMDEGEEEDAPKKSSESKKTPKDISTETVLGMELTPLTKNLRQRYRLDNDTKGLLVIGVNRSSEAIRRGVREGNVIVSVNGTAVSTMNELKAAIKSARSEDRKYALFGVRYEKDTAFLTLPLEEKKD